MTADQAEIRALIDRWHAASAAGDTAAVLALMTDDARFLLPGRAPMTKGEFARLMTPAPGVVPPTISVTQDIHDIEISSDLACLWSALQVSITPTGGAAPMLRAGHTLTVFRRVNGRWLLARDANLLVPKTG